MPLSRAGLAAGLGLLAGGAGGVGFAFAAAVVGWGLLWPFTRTLGVERVVGADGGAGGGGGARDCDVGGGGSISST
jgi:hypothetical protein